MESFGFELKLVSDIDRVSKRSADALKTVQAQAEKTQKSLSWADNLGKQFEKVGFAAARAAKKQQDQFANSWAKIGVAAAREAQKAEKLAEKQRSTFAKLSAKISAQEERAQGHSDKIAQRKHKAFADAWSKIGQAAEKAQQRERKAQDRSYLSHERAVERRQKELEEKSLGGGFKEGLGFNKITSAAFYGTLLAEGAFKAVSIMVDGIHKVVDVFQEGIERAFDEASKQQTLQLGERLSLGKESKGYREDVGRFSRLTGFNEDQIRQLLLPLRRAGIGQQGTRTAFAAAADVAAGEGRGGDLGRVSELLQSFVNIQLRGGVRERQLAALGVNEKAFYAALAKDLKLGNGQAGIDAAKKKAESGTVDPQLLLNNVYRQIEAKQGGKLGTGAIEFSKTFEAHLSKVKNLPNEFLKNLVDSPEFARANDLLGGLLENLDPDSPAGHRIMASLENAFQRITGFIGDPKEASQSIADHIEDAVHFGEDLADTFRSWADLLVPSLDTLESMVLQAEKIKAYINFGSESGQHDIIQVNEKIEDFNRRVKARDVEKDLRGRDPGLFKEAVQRRLDAAQDVQNRTGQYGPIYLPRVEAAARADVEQTKNQLRRAAGVQVHAPVTVQVQGGDDPQGHAQEIGKHVGRHVQREVERAAQEGGG